MEKPQNVCKNCNSVEDLKTCGRCGRVFYCSPECQKANWKMHKFECKLTAVLTGKQSLQSIVGEKCKYCGKNSSQLKKCGACLSISYCSKDCQKSDWRDHKLLCMAIKPPDGTNMEARITEGLDVLLSRTQCKENSQSTESAKDAGRVLNKSSSSGLYHTIQEAVDLATEMFPLKTVISKFEFIPTELYGFRLCQGQQVLVATLTGYHPERKRHGMMICDEDNYSSFITFHVLTIPYTEPYFKWEDVKPGNFICVVDPCLQSFPGGFLGFVIDEACDIRVIPGDVVKKDFYKQEVLHTSTYEDN